jgi:hypothetical protein
MGALDISQKPGVRLLAASKTATTKTDTLVEMVIPTRVVLVNI